LIVEVGVNGLEFLLTDIEQVITLVNKSILLFVLCLQFWDGWVKNIVKSLIDLLSEDLTFVNFIIDALAFILNLFISVDEIVHLFLGFWSFIVLLDLFVVFIELVNHLVDGSNDVLLSSLKTEWLGLVSIFTWLFGFVTVDISIAISQLVFNFELNIVVLLLILVIKSLLEFSGIILNLGKLIV
jgi:hypothetical protein